MSHDKHMKTDSDRIMRIHDLCEEYFGDVRFVGVKYHTQIGWVAKVQFEENINFGNLTADGDDSTDALRKLKSRVKKIISRHNKV